MRDDDCRYWRELLGARLAGQLDPEENAELERHLENCPHCRAEEVELLSAAEFLGEPGDREAGENLDLPPGLKESVVERVLGRPRRVPVAVVSAAAALLFVMIGVTALFVGLPNLGGTPGLGDEEPISFEAPPRGVTIEASVVAHTWGTEFFMEAEGLESGEVYTVSIERADGTSAPTGTFIGVGEAEIDCVLNGAVLRQNAESVTITDSSGEVVMRSDLADRSPSLYT